MNIVCFYWGDVDMTWGMSDWTWSECELAKEICAVWGTSGEWWRDANWMWLACSGSLPIATVSSFTGGVDATTLIQPWLIEPWNPYKQNDERDKKRKRLIKLICKVKGQTYEEEKKAGTMDIKVDDVKMVVKKVLNIDLDVKLEE